MATKIKTVLFIVLINLITSATFTASAQAMYTQTENDIRFEHLTVKDGLGANRVRAIFQDSQGFMWFGTWEGLHRYDGYSFLVYKNDPDDPYSLSNNVVTDIHEDPSGILWIGTANGGLNRFDPTLEQFTQYRNDPDDPDSLSHDVIVKIYEDRAGILWIGTWGGGLNKFDPTTEVFTHYQNDPEDLQSISGNYVSGLLEDSSGEFWIETRRSGLNRFDRETETFTQVQYEADDPKGLSSSWAQQNIVEDESGQVWFATETGLYKFDHQTGIFTRFIYNRDNPDYVFSSGIKGVYKDSSDTLWVAINRQHGGLYKFDKTQGEFIHYQHDPDSPESLISSSVEVVYQDQSGGLWVGTEGGLNRSKQLKFSEALAKEYRVNIMVEGQSKILWFGTQNGLGRYDPDTRKIIHYTNDPDDSNSYSGQLVRAVFEDQDGYVWFGGQSSGLYRFDPATEQLKVYKHNPDDPHSLSDDYILSIYGDAAGMLWVGTDKGFNRFDPETEQFTVYRHQPDNPQSLGDDNIRFIYEDNLEVLWLGSWYGGLTRFDKETEAFRNYQEGPNSLGSIKVENVYEDSFGGLWIGTSQGLYIFDRETEMVKRYTEKDGLSSDTVQCILEDEQGNLWISSRRGGISKFNIQSELFKNYDFDDGLQENFHSASCHKNQSGQMFFGGDAGIQAFYPEQITDNFSMPQVVLTEFLLFNEPVNIGDDSPLQQHISVANTINLTHDQTVFSFKFSALNFSSPEKNQYAYKMEGFDNDWIFVDSAQRLATYTNLDPGNYVFRVKASNNDDLWNEEGVSININITPPWWQTFWFRGALLLLVVGLVAGGFRWQVYSVEQRNRQLEAQVSERTAELTVSNNQLEISREKAEIANAHLKREIKERKRAEDKLQELAITDSLTELYNRRHVFFLAERELARALRYKQEFSLLLIDLDNFKTVNDTYGHLNGDRVLQEVARSISQNSRDVDIYGRYGGDEFIILLPETEQSFAQTYAERLCQKTSAQLQEITEITDPVTLSIGIANFAGEEGITINTLFERADQALYAAKEGGANCAKVWQPDDSA